jgi:hypothetical protein
MCRLILALLAAGLPGALCLAYQPASVKDTSANHSGSPERSLIRPLYVEVRALVRRFYPQATLQMLNKGVHFEYNSRTFLIHPRSRTGNWQDTVGERGPSRGGILCDIELRPGRYNGAAIVPQTFDMQRFKLLLMAPYSKRNDCYLYVHLYYPEDVSPEFVREFRTLIASFESV